MDTITADEFRQRLVALCLSGGKKGLPRKRRDQLILLKSISVSFARDRKYTEADVNEEIKAWLADVGRSVGLDHVTFRRLLVDDGFLVRDDGGAAYRIGSAPFQEVFEASVDGIDPSAVIAEARVDREHRRREHAEKLNSNDV
jgi:hypothetical protein